MENEIKDITLLLMYLTGWIETSPRNEDSFRTWIGYGYQTVNKLKEDESIIHIPNHKSIILTDKGIIKAKELQKKYLGK
jgi:hypothetical protein